MLGGEHVDAFGKSSERSGGLLFDMASQQFTPLADSGVDRAQHTVVAQNGVWYIFGGLSSNVVQTYDEKTQMYGTVGDAATNPTARTGHTAVVGKNAMFVLGGQLADGSLDGVMRVFCLKKFVWHDVATPFAGGIVAHSAVVKDNLMWVFGGRDSAGNALASLWTYDLETEMWAESDAAGDDHSSPSARSGHAAIVVGDEMLVFGGQLASGSFVNDVWALHLDARTRAAPSWQRAAIVDGATAPAARAHSVVALYDNALWCFGGRDAKQTFLDVWALDLEFLQWELITCLPGAAFPHCREAAIKMNPPVDQTLSSFRFINPGVSEATYTIQLHSAPSHPVHVMPEIDAGHVQVCHFGQPSRTQ